MPKRKRTPEAPPLSRRERQIMDILFQLGEASAAEVRAALPDPPGYSTVRSLLSIMVDKGHVLYREKGLRYVYLPADDSTDVREEALRHVVRTFFDGSVQQAVAAMLRMSDRELTSREITRLKQQIRKARASEGEK
jgi:predicted transcriptional regulator